MFTVEEILAAAARLGPAELRQLKDGIVRLEGQARALVLTVGEQTYYLTRLGDYEFHALRQHSIAIKEDLGFSLRFFLSLHERGEELNFAQVHAALAHLTGESGRTFDPYKGSFSFPFELRFTREGRERTYLFEVRNCRDSLYFPLRKVVAADDDRLQQHSYYPPVPDEFSQDEINRFTVYLYGYLKGCLKALPASAVAPFVANVQAGLIVYGCCRGSFFEQEFDSEDDYLAALRSYREQVEREKLEPADSCVVVNVERPVQSP